MLGVLLGLCGVNFMEHQVLRLRVDQRTQFVQMEFFTTLLAFINHFSLGLNFDFEPVCIKDGCDSAEVLRESCDNNLLEDLLITFAWHGEAFCGVFGKIEQFILL